MSKQGQENTPEAPENPIHLQPAEAQDSGPGEITGLRSAITDPQAIDLPVPGSSQGTPKGRLVRQHWAVREGGNPGGWSLGRGGGGWRRERASHPTGERLLALEGQGPQ